MSRGAADAPHASARARPLVVLAICLVAGGAASCEKSEAAPRPLERRPSASAPDAPRGIACGPRGLPPDRHFVADGLCARVVATRQGPLRGVVFAPEGDLIAVTTDGKIKRYRDADRDGIFAPGPPETVVWATTGSGSGHNCHLDGEDLYCGSKSGVRKWRYAPQIDQGGPGEDVVVGMPEAGPRPAHSVGVWDGFLYVGADDETSRSVVKRFALERRPAGRPFRWRDGDIFVRGPSALSIAFTAANAPKVAEALSPRWQGGVFVALHGSRSRDASTGHKVVWLPFDAAGKLPMPAAMKDATELPYDVVFGGGKYGAPRDGEWSWRIGDAGEDPVTPVGVAISPIDGALYMSSDNAGGSGSIYRIARLGR